MLLLLFQTFLIHACRCVSSVSYGLCCLVDLWISHEVDATVAYFGLIREGGAKQKSSI